MKSVLSGGRALYSEVCPVEGGGLGGRALYNEVCPVGGWQRTYSEVCPVWGRLDSKVMSGVGVLYRAQPLGTMG